MTISDYLQRLENGNASQRAAAIALRYGDEDAAHHQRWIIDQMLRLIAGLAYPAMIRAFEDEGNEWDTGIAP